MVGDFMLRNDLTPLISGVQRKAWTEAMSRGARRFFGNFGLKNRSRRPETIMMGLVWRLFVLITLFALGLYWFGPRKLQRSPASDSAATSSPRPKPAPVFE